jgi:hypothetical protein
MRTARTLEAEWWPVLRGSVGTGAEEGVMYWARLGFWISPCYGRFPLSGRFETYEPFIFLVFQLFSGRRETRLFNQ